VGELDGRVALVTGGSRGIGRAIALALARAGADVAIGFVARSDDAERTSAEVRAAARRSVAVRADVARGDGVSALLAAVEHELGSVEILVNNAGIAIPRPIEEVTESDWDRLLDVNLKSAFLLTQAVLPGMRERRWGRIINVSSTAAQVGGVVGPHYAASKAGLIGLTHAYAALLAGEGITVNAIAPALIETEMLAGLAGARAAMIPAGRFGTADEVARAAILLATDGFITGQTINVNGGLYMS
jgi:3-oxoacyl-[acyl-carrier protein] reductase